MRGLTKEEVEKRRVEFGFNEIQEKTESSVHRLLKKLWGPIPWMIEVAAILSIVLADWVDFFIILVLLIVNVLVDFVQESKAVNALAKIKSQITHKALVYRDDTYKYINTRELVPGDIIKLKIGDIAPADSKLISGEYLQVDQSALTGESLPVSKKIGDGLYSGSIIKRGEMIAEVLTIGDNTFSGKNAHLIARATEEEQSHFQKAIIHIGRFLIILSASLAILVLMVSVVRHDSLVEDMRFVLVLLVASIPVALPAVLSVTMAVGALSIAKKKAVVRNLSAIEELAGTDILCSDKTGTLTQNKLSIHKPIIYGEYTQEELFLYASLASQEENNDPIETPIFSYAKEHFPKMDLHDYTFVSFEPFDPITKYTKAIFSIHDKEGTAMKGAPQVIAKYIQNKTLRETLLANVKNLAERGFRSLAVGHSVGQDGEFHIVGLIPFFDPPREDSMQVIQKVRDMGITIKMLTGDNQAIAKEISTMLKIGANILPVSQMRSGDLHEEQILLAEIIAKGLYKKLGKTITDEELEDFGRSIAKEVQIQLDDTTTNEGYIKKHESEIIKLIEKADGFSEVLPEDKYFIIDELQKNKHFVAMTGDGVNDAPALKKADVGIAVAGATDAARAASDLVLLAPGLSVIEDAIKMSRKTFERMKSYATFRIAETIRIVLFMSLSIIVFNFYPVTAVMIIMLALLNDIPVMMIAYDNAPINNNPVHWNMKEVLTISTVLGIAGVISSFIIFFFLQTQNYPLALIQAMLFLKLDVAGHSTLYLTRTGRKHFWEKPYPSLKFFIPAFTTRILGTLIAVYGIFMEPIGWTAAGLIWLYATAWWILNDYIKIGAYKIHDRNTKTKMSYKTVKEYQETLQPIV